MKGVLFLIITTIAACAAPRNAVPVKTTFDKEGHRGCRGLMPENTIPAMLKAIDLGVTTLEMDVVITKDSQVILSHEPFFNHEITTKPDGTAIPEAAERSYNIYQMSYAETQQYDVGLKPHPKFPTATKVGSYKTPVVCSNRQC
jgi:glycerophosphoryl diester phosphodiesterase